MARKRQIKRGQSRRREKNIVLIGTEGKNKTERLYFHALGQTVTDKYSVRFAKGNSTDPVGIVKDTIKSKDAVCTDPGDMAFAVFDTDADPQKQGLVDQAVQLANRESVEVVVSTPCFEVWFLLHYRYSTHSFVSNAEVINSLRQYIPDYQKSSDVFSVIGKDTKKAIIRAKTLDDYHDDQGHRKHSITRNPSIETHIIVERLQS